MKPTISVIIATYTRSALLDQCLQRLAEQAFQDGDEVIVVDNGSVDDTTAVVNGHQAAFPVPLHLMYEALPGKSHALARALGVARRDVLAFLDDDVTVAPGWLATIRDTMTDPSVALMGGSVAPNWESTVPDWIRSAPRRYPRLGAPLGLLDYPGDVVELGPRTVLGANLAARRQVFEALGGFATHLGKLRGTLLSGEDHELCLRVQRAGFKAIYVPAARVHHWVPAERARIGYFLQWFYWSGITNAMLDNATGVPERQGTRPRPVLGVPAYLIKRAMLAAVRGVTALILGSRTTALNHAIDVAFVAGYTAHCWGVARAHTPAEQITPEAA